MILMKKSLHCYMAFLITFYISNHVNGFSTNEEKEIKTAREVLKTVEERIISKIHEKYAKQRDEYTMGNFNRILNHLINNGKRIAHAPRLPHRELEELSSLYNDAPR